MFKNINKKAVFFVLLLVGASQLVGVEITNVVTSDKIDQEKQHPGKTIVIDVKKQAWQERRVVYIKAVKNYSQNPNDKDALNIIDKALGNYEKQPWSITPMEAMDLLQTFYVPKEGLKTMPMLVAEAILGYRDTLQWASKSGQSEIIWNEQFFVRALTNGGRNKKTMDEWLKFVEEKPDEAKQIVDTGVKFAKKLDSAKDGYDRKWPTAYGLEVMINAMDGKKNEARDVPNVPDEKALNDAINKISAYYLPKSLVKK